MSSGAQDSTRHMLSKLGLAQVIFGVVGFFMSFSWITHILAIASGSIIIKNFGTAGAELPPPAGCCGASYHIRGLCIAILAFSCLELLAFGVTSATVSMFLLDWAAAVGTAASGTEYASIVEGPLAGIRYIAIAIILGAACAGVNLILAALVMWKYDALQRSKVMAVPMPPVQVLVLSQA